MPNWVTRFLEVTCIYIELVNTPVKKKRLQGFEDQNPHRKHGQKLPRNKNQPTAMSKSRSIQLRIPEDKPGPGSLVIYLYSLLGAVPQVVAWPNGFIFFKSLTWFVSTGK